MKKLIVLGLLALGIYACNPSNTTKNTSNNSTEPAASNTESSNAYNPNRGEGKFKDLEIPAHLDQPMALEGKTISDLKCASCHKLTDEKLVGPGWKGVSERRSPEWIMNFITNPDPMIDKDPELQAQLEICLVRMPNQNISDDDARKILEYMRQNDGVK